MTARAQRPIPARVEHNAPLRRGWTTGACATAAAKAAWAALLTGAFPDPVEIGLPGGTAAFALAEAELGAEWATAAVVKDAGDDPDVTHGALVRATVRRLPTGAGVQFLAGPGVGAVTLPGLPVPPGEPAINPAPRQQMRAAIQQVAEACGASPDASITLSIPGGEALASRTMNPRLGIVGGLSILGTTGVVVPYSCAAWIHSIHRGIDVARATGLRHVAGATGRTSELAVQRHHGLPEQALIDMGDFVGGMLKYLRAHPVERITVAGGVAKMAKLAQGRLDLHSKRGGVDLVDLAHVARDLGAPDALSARIAGANTAAEAFGHAAAAGLALGDAVAGRAWQTAARVLEGAPVTLDVLLFDRMGCLAGATPCAPVHDAGPGFGPGRNLRR